MFFLIQVCGSRIYGLWVVYTSVYIMACWYSVGVKRYKSIKGFKIVMKGRNQIVIYYLTSNTETWEIPFYLQRQAKPRHLGNRPSVFRYHEAEPVWQFVWQWIYSVNNTILVRK